MPYPSPEERFMEKLLLMPNGCWQWTGKTRFGYGRFVGRTTRKHVAAHRFAYEWLIGPIEDELQIDHLCRNRGCVNPGHMEQVTQIENVRRGISPAAINHTKTHCVHGHIFDDANTYLTKTNKRQCRTCDRIRHKESYVPFRQEDDDA